MKALADLIAERALDVDTVSDTAQLNAERWDRMLLERSKALHSASDEMSRQVRDVGQSLEQQVSTMREASRDASELVETLKVHAEAAGKEDFLKLAAFISERLQSLAVDMNRLMETTISEDDWRRFNRGEKGIFVRKILGFRERAKLAAIKQRYQEDGEFRDYVGRYISEFNNLLKEAKSRDHDAILSTTFLSSDMGKVYMLLSRAIGRDI
jgi:hypothetical protein